MKYRVVGMTRLNYYPGTMQETPPTYRREIVGPWLKDESEARRKMLVWKSAVKSPGWEFTIEKEQP